MNNIREIIYSLKHIFGTPLDIYTISSPMLNPETGKNTITRHKQHIKKAIVLTSSLKHLAPLFPSKFTKFSGEFDVDFRNVIIDPRDLTTVPNLTDYIDFNDQRYDIAEVNSIEQKGRIYGYSLLMKEAKESILYKQVDVKIGDNLVMIEKIGGEKGMGGVNEIDLAVSDQIIFIDDISVNENLDTYNAIYNVCKFNQSSFG